MHLVPRQQNWHNLALSNSVSTKIPKRPFLSRPWLFLDHLLILKYRKSLAILGLLQSSSLLVAYPQAVLNFCLVIGRSLPFELLKGVTPYLVSSEAHSTGLCDVSRGTRLHQVKQVLFPCTNFIRD